MPMPLKRPDDRYLTMPSPSSGRMNSKRLTLIWLPKRGCSASSPSISKKSPSLRENRLPTMIRLSREPSSSTLNTPKPVSGELKILRLTFTL